MEKQIDEKKSLIQILLLISAVISALKISEDMVWTFLLFIIFLLLYYVGLTSDKVKENIKRLNELAISISVFFSLFFANTFTTSYFIYHEEYFSSVYPPILKIIIFSAYYFGMIYILYKILSIKSDGDDNIIKKIIEFFKTHWIEIIGFIILVIGIIFYVLYCETDWCEFGKILIPIGIAIIAAGISVSSDRRLKESQYIEFRRIKGQFEDIRLNLRERKELLMRPVAIKGLDDESKKIIQEFKSKDLNEFRIKYSFGIWKCRTYIDEINTIKRIINKKDQESFIRLLALYFVELLEGRIILSTSEMVFDIGKNYKKQLQQMYDIVMKFSVFEKIKDEKLGIRLLQAKNMIMNDVTDIEEIKKLYDI